MSHTQSGHDGGAGGYGEGKDPGSVPPDQNTAELWQRLVQECRTTDFTTFKHQLPLARIKKIMKSDSDVHMISAEAPLLFSKACELFILDLTLRAWRHAEMNNHKTLGKEDIADAITDSYMFDFLADIITKDEEQDDTAVTSYTQNGQGAAAGGGARGSMYRGGAMEPASSSGMDDGGDDDDGSDDEGQNGGGHLNTLSPPTLNPGTSAPFDNMYGR